MIVNSLQNLGQKAFDILQRLGRGHILFMHILTGLPGLLARFGLVIQQVFSVGVLSLVNSSLAESPVSLLNPVSVGAVGGVSSTMVKSPTV